MTDSECMRLMSSVIEAQRQQIERLKALVYDAEGEMRQLMNTNLRLRTELQHAESLSILS